GRRERYLLYPSDGEMIEVRSEFIWAVTAEGGTPNGGSIKMRPRETTGIGSRFADRVNASQHDVRGLERVGNVPQPPLVSAQMVSPPSPRMPSRPARRTSRQCSGRCGHSCEGS